MNVDWPEYRRVHASRSNLLLHLLAVPLFVASFVLLIFRAVDGDLGGAGFALAVSVAAMALQGRGHKLEEQVPRPFNSPWNFLRRWFTEQFFIFPLFFLTGRWWRQYVACGRMTGDES